MMAVRSPFSPRAGLGHNPRHARADLERPQGHRRARSPLRPRPRGGGDPPPPARRGDAPGDRRGRAALAPSPPGRRAGRRVRVRPPRVRPQREAAARPLRQRHAVALSDRAHRQREPDAQAQEGARRAHHRGRRAGRRAPLLGPLRQLAPRALGARAPLAGRTARLGAGHLSPQPAQPLGDRGRRQRLVRGRGAVAGEACGLHGRVADRSAAHPDLAGVATGGRTRRRVRARPAPLPPSLHVAPQARPRGVRPPAGPLGPATGDGTPVATIALAGGSAPPRRAATGRDRPTFTPSATRAAASSRRAPRPTPRSRRARATAPPRNPRTPAPAAPRSRAPRSARR